MPDFWQFPTVSMGLGPLMAIYQARFMKYLQDRGLAQTEGRKVWAFMGDGEMDEPESMGAIGMAARENLDNLIFVVNCNLQRLDGPVRGNGKIIQELESDFRGAGWNVIKVVWGRHWDPLLARDKKGILMRRMMEVVDGEYQTFKSKDGAYVREHFFNTPELKELVADYSDDDIWKLNRGGHDPFKVYDGVPRGGEPQGPADRHPRQDDQGLRDGRVGRGAEHHAPAEEDVATSRSAASATASPFPSPTTSSTRCRTSRFPRARPSSSTCARAGWSWAATCRRGGSKARRARHARALRVRAVPEEHRGPRDLDDDGVRADPADAAARQEHRQAHRADRPRRVAHVRHGGHVPPARHLEPAGPALHAARTPTSSCSTRRSRTARSCRKGINEAGGMCDWIAAATSLLDARRADDPVLHLLLDVRLPADRRPRVGGGRHALARLPAGRHRGPHDAERRGPAARGRPLAPDLGDGPELHLVRSDVRLRGRGDHPGRPAADVRRAGGRATTT